MLHQNEFRKTYTAQHQPVPVTPVHLREAGEENEEEQRKSTSSEFDLRCQGVAMKGFWLALILILLHFHGIQVEATEGLLGKLRL